MGGYRAGTEETRNAYTILFRKTILKDNFGDLIVDGNKTLT